MEQTRRRLLVLALAAGAGLLSAGARAKMRFETDPFQLGVASGSPSEQGVVLWTRLLPLNPVRNPWANERIDVRWQVADDEAFSRGLREGAVQAVPELAHSVHAEVDGLLPDRHYHYRFIVGDVSSPIGRTRTLPAAIHDVKSLRLAFGSCQRLATAPFNAYAGLIDEGADLMVFLGDYIYDAGAYPSPTVPRCIAAATILEGYRAHYELHKRDAELQVAHAAMPWLPIWDDHEVVNDYAGAVLQGLAQGRAATQRRAAYQAWWEHMPVRHSALVRGVTGLLNEGAELRIYQRLVWGRLAGLHLLDGRQYRDPQACSGPGGLINPQGCDPLNSPSRSLLGHDQETWLEQQLASHGRAQPWQLLLQTTMFSPRRIPFGGSHRLWNDGWDGYPAARKRLIDALIRHDVAGPVFLGGDLHENWACNVPAGSEDTPEARRCVATEFVGTGITQTSFVPRMIDEIRAANPHAVYADAGRSGYGVLTLRPERAELSFRVLQRGAGGGATLSTAARFEVDPRQPGARLLPA